MTIHGSPIPEHRSHVGLGLALVGGLPVALVSAMLVGGARTANQASGLIAFARADGVYVMRADGTGVRRIIRRRSPVSTAERSPGRPTARSS